jgi:hypothetical protein
MWASIFLVIGIMAAQWHGVEQKPIPPAQRTVAELQALQPQDLRTDLTSRAGERAAFDKASRMVQETLALPAGLDADARLPEALNAIALFNLERTQALPALLRVLDTLEQKDANYQREVLSAVHTLYWKEAAPRVRPLLAHIKTPREFAIAAYVLLRADDTAEARTFIRQQTAAVFADQQQEPRLVALARRLQATPAQEVVQRPALLDLLRAPLRPGYPVVYSFQRSNREQHGLAVVRAADGRFVRNGDGSYFNIVQMALAMTQLPGTITNGNTPQGLFVIKGTGTATNPWIGPTPYLRSMVPFEAQPGDFDNPAHDAAPATWSEALYLSYFPPGWRNYRPIREAYLAGQAGRDDMLLHGNAVNPDYYRNERYFPYAPAAGCMVAQEYWSKDNGTLVHSDQLGLIKAFTSRGQRDGYVFVIELDDRQQPVTLADVVQDMMAAESP